MVCRDCTAVDGFVAMDTGVRKSTGPGVHLRGPRWQTSQVRRTRGPCWATRIDPTTLGTMMSEHAVYGAHATAAPRTKVRVHHLQKMKAEGHKWAMLTAYDYSTARVFDDAGIPVLLVGDSAANVVYGYDTTVPISIDELIPLVRGVVRGAPHALVVADMPFGSYEAGPTAALSAATRFMKEAGAHAVKLEGGERVAEQIAMLTAAGIPVMAHIGFTPQSVNTLGGFRVQGRGDAAEQTVADAIAVAEAGAFSVVMEMVPAELATQITGKLTIPTVGIGAGPNCDAQVLVWQDMAGLTSGKTARFVKRFGDVGSELRRAATEYAEEVAAGTFPADEHSF
jgi:3-methyl-2-oxobutanoate hydroxymethyltransferase